MEQKIKWQQRLQKNLRERKLKNSLNKRPVNKKLDLHKALQEYFGFDKFKGSTGKNH